MSSNREDYNVLYDFYGSLLTERQRRFFEDYYREDLSLKEIAENEGISRAAVSDALKRCREELTAYENKLHLASSFKKRMELYERIRTAAKEDIGDLIKECINTEIEGGKL